MLGNRYEGQICSIARTLEIVGERWTLLILRDALLGLRRFEQFQDSLGIARNVLTARLGTLVDAGLLERVQYQDRPPRHEYRTTAKGRDLATAIFALMHWGDRHLAGPEGKPRLTEHSECGGDVTTALTCTRCTAEVGLDAVDVLPGPALADSRPHS